MSSNDETMEASDFPEPTKTLESGAPRGMAMPDRIGQFKICAKIGEGSMGTVYEAEQESPKRTVALKVIRAGLASSALLKRFELESQVLGRLQHPGIAQVYQAGTADTESGKRPYFAMEYVRGVDLRQYVSQKNLSTRERLELLAQICDAVHHAHQKGVIHRDLKPGNILVDQSGQPKILDFGVARATDSDMQITTMQTDVGQLIGTLQYMSPEQVAADPNDLDTRSDVYALGVIAYEMLTGQVPYNLKNKMIHEAARIIREEEPTVLSSTSRVFRGDIETIVAKALEKDKERRYQSAAGLAEDVRRYLQDEPILARPQSAMYQLQKFAKRNKALAGGLAVAMTALAIGMATSTYLFYEAENARQGETQQRRLAEEREAEAVVARSAEEVQRKVAEQQAERAEEEARIALTEKTRSEQVATFLKDMLAGVGPSVALGRDTTMLREILDQTAERVGTGLEGQPEVEADLRNTIGKTYVALGMYDRADSMLRPALALRQSLFGDEHLAVAESLDGLAVLLYQQGRLSEAEPLFRGALAMWRKLLGDGHLHVATGVNNLAQLLKDQGRLSEADPLFREALAISRKVLGNEHPQVAQALNSLALLLQLQGKLSEAEPLFREGLAMSRKLLGDEHPNVSVALNGFAALLHQRGELTEAEPLFREALALNRKLMGDEHPDVALALNNLAVLVQDQGRLAEAESLYHEALAMRRRLLGDEHPNVATDLNNLAFLLYRQGKLSEAEPLFREALAMHRKLLGDGHSTAAVSAMNLGRLLRDKGDLDQAEPLLQQATENLTVAVGENHWITGVARCHLGDCLIRMQRYGEAEGELLDAQNILKAGLGDGHERTMLTVQLLATLYEAWDAAEPGKGHAEKAAEYRAMLPEPEESDDTPTEEP